MKELEVSEINDQNLSAEQSLIKIRKLAQLLDEAFVIPGTNYRIGLDALIGLFPGIGDLITAAISVYIVAKATEMGVSKWVLVKMLANIGIDTLVGAFPLAGDFFDAAFKSNLRNVDLLERALKSPNHAKIPSEHDITKIPGLKRKVY